MNDEKISFLGKHSLYKHYVLVVPVDVVMSDKGMYSCNLHHHYCHLYESIKVQLNVTKSGW